jgi:hypothetical protein
MSDKKVLSDTSMITHAVIAFVSLNILHHDQCDPDYERYCGAVYNLMLPAHRDTLRQLIFAGPVYDGDVISKAARDDLLSMGLASRACVAGEQGYTVANYRGWDVLNASIESKYQYRWVPLHEDPGTPWTPADHLPSGYVDPQTQPGHRLWMREK